MNWDSKAGKNLRLADIFATGYHDKLNAVAEKIFRKNEKLSDTASLATNYFFKDNKFALNTNFSITPLGIKFLYNQYDIKPYAAGITELFIPYAQIKSLVQPGSVVSQFIK
ncbi:RsiV family protein [Mucilaginibacter sp. UC70_90]